VFLQPFSSWQFKLGRFYDHWQLLEKVGLDEILSIVNFVTAITDQRLNGLTWLYGESCTIFQWLQHDISVM
jgi:hypothetical protein